MKHVSFKKFKELIGNDARMNQISADGDFTYEEKRKVLMFATVALEHLDYDVNEVFESLVSCRLVIKDNLVDDANNDLDDSFVLSKEDGAWVLYQCLSHRKKPIKVGLDELHEELRQLLQRRADVIPTALSEEDRVLIKKNIGLFLFVNFLEAFNTKVFTMGKSVEKVQKRVDRVSLLDIMPEEINPDIQTADGGKLFLLPGSDSLLLDLGRTFSFGIQGLGKGADFFKTYSENIYALNHFIREIASRHNIDVVIIDLSPSADDFNSTMLMTSDYFLTTVNPEAFSDDAMESLHTILSRWREDFEELYSRNDEDMSHYYRIEKPPKSLGYFLQKMPMKSDQLQSEVSSDIAKEIKVVFEQEIIPLLRQNDMYPSFGLEGYDENGVALSDKISHDIPKFRGLEIKAQHAGRPVVWNAESTVYTSAFERVLSRTIGRAIVMDPLFSARLKASFKELADQQEKKGESAFSEKWSKHFYEAYEQQSIEERKKRISDVYYRFDYLDMLFFTASIRYKFNSSFDSGLSLKDGSSDICENSLGVLLLNPCSVDEVNGKLSEILEKIRIRWKTTTKLSYIIIPFFTGEYWMCVRVELNQEKKSISVLFDDPQGGVFDKNDKVPGDKDNKVRNVISKRVVDNVMKAANSCIASYLSRRAGDRHLQLHSRSFVCKHVDQQGYLANDCDSGPIILSNIQDYLKMTGKRKLYSNRAFEHTAKLYKAAGVMKDHNLSQYRCEESEPEARESLDEEKGGLYHISEYVLKSVKNRKRRINPILS